MSEINLSSAVRSSLNSLQSTAELLSSTQERLATGNRVNSALDDPTAFFTATALNDRAADLSTLLDEQGQAIQVIEAADNGISAISDLVDSARAIATQALQTDDQSERATLAGQFDAILGQIEDLAGDASFNGINLLDSTNSQDLQVVFNEDSSSSLTVEGVNFTDLSDAAGLNLARQGGGTASTGTVTFADLDESTDTLTVNSGADGAANIAINLSDVAQAAVTGSSQVDASDDIASGAISDGNTVSFAVGGGANIDVTITTGANALTELQANTDLEDAGFTFADGGSGAITVTNSNDDFTADIAGAGIADSADTDNGGTAFEAEVVASDAVVFSAQSVADAINADAANTGDAAVVASVDGDGNLALSSAGGNLTAGDGDNVDVTGTGFVAGGNNFATNEDINNTLAAIDSALGTIRTTASTLGTNLNTIQIRSDFTSDLINTLEQGAADLTLADLNEEGANLLTLQTRQSLASTSLSFATQANNSVLSLF